LENRSLGARADVVGHLEHAESTAALGVRLAFRDALAVELGHLLDQVVVLEQDRTVRTDGQRVLVARNRYPGIGRRLRTVLIAVFAPSIASLCRELDTSTSFP
jgi:hypothetical protein